ncbi:RNA recognition motif 2-domain-containing protein [Schizophyllum fasciatum]
MPASLASADPPITLKHPKPTRRHVPQSASLPNIHALPSPPSSIIMDEPSPSHSRDASFAMPSAPTNAGARTAQARLVSRGERDQNRALLTPPLTPSSTLRTATSFGSMSTDEDVGDVLHDDSDTVSRAAVATGSGDDYDAPHEQDFLALRWRAHLAADATDGAKSASPMFTPRAQNDFPPAFVPQHLSANPSSFTIPQARLGGPKPFIPNQHFTEPPVETGDHRIPSDIRNTPPAHPKAVDLRAFIQPCFQHAPGQGHGNGMPSQQHQQQQQQQAFYQGVPMSPQVPHPSMFYPPHPPSYPPPGIHCSPGSPPMQFEHPPAFMIPPHGLPYGQPMPYFGGYAPGLPGPAPAPEPGVYWDGTPPAPMLPPPPQGFVPDDLWYMPPPPHGPQSELGYAYADEGALGAAGHVRRPSPPRGLRRKQGPNARSRDPGVTAEHNMLNLERIEQGLDTRTTVMIKNIPNKMTDGDLQQFIAKVCPRRIDFMYLRVDFSNGCNVGYACVNFIDVKDLVHFARSCLGKKWNMYNSEKVLHMCYANYQGKEALVEKFKNSGIMEVKENWRPRIFHSFGPSQGLPEEFPKPTHLRRKERSSLNRTLYTPGEDLETAQGNRRRLLKAAGRVENL